jgi:probable phosphoglycerate mutase
VQQQSSPLETTLVLIRHARAADRDGEGRLRLCGHLDVPLTRRGQLEARRLGPAIARLGRVDALYSSTLRQALATAEPVARELGLEPRRWASLREVSCGVLDGALVAQIKQRYPALWSANLAQADERFSWPGGETYQAFRRRVLRSIGRIALAHAGGRVVIVTHTGVISQLLGHLAGESPARWERYRPGPASLTVVRWTAGASRLGRLLRFDDRRHLARLEA